MSSARTIPLPPSSRFVAVFVLRPHAAPCRETEDGLFRRSYIEVERDF